MFIVNAQHPTVCGTVLKLFHTRAAAEAEGVAILRMIADDLLRSHENIHAEPHAKAFIWEDMKARSDIPFVALERFVVGLDDEDEDNQEWCVELIEKRPVDASDMFSALQAAADALTPPRNAEEAGALAAIVEALGKASRGEA